MFRVQGVNAEIELTSGATIYVTTNDKYKESVDTSYIWVDYANITSALSVGKKIYIDDGLISLIVREITGEREHSGYVLVALKSHFLSLNTWRAPSL